MSKKSQNSQKIIKWSLITIGSLLVIWGLMLALTWNANKTVVQFFDYIRGTNYSYALKLTSPKFQENTDLAKLVDLTNSLDLKASTSFSAWWRVPGFSSATLYGTLHYPDHDLGAKVVLFKGTTGWVISTLKVSGDRQDIKLNKEEITAILQDSLSGLLYGVQKSEYQALYNSLGVRLKEQLTLEDFAKGFSDLEQQLKGITFTDGEKLELAAKTWLDSTGIVHADGSYPLPDNKGKLEFSFKYVKEDAAWKLIAISAKRNA